MTDQEEQWLIRLGKRFRRGPIPNRISRRTTLRKGLDTGPETGYYELSDPEELTTGRRTAELITIT